MSEAQQRSGGIIDCGWCETHVDGPCPQCAKLRRRAVALRNRMDAAQIARELSIPPQRAARLLAQADIEDALQRLELGAATVPVRTLRSLWELRREQDGELTEAGLARDVQMARIDLRRALGRSPAKSRNGSEARVQQQVTLPTAERIAGALGVLPADIARM